MELPLAAKEVESFQERRRRLYAFGPAQVVGFAVSDDPGQERARQGQAGPAEARACFQRGGG